MLENTLMKSQKNEILDLIKETSLDSFSFKWSDVDSQLSDNGGFPLTVSKLSYDNSSYYFVFDLHKNQHYSFYSPGNSKLHQEEYPGGWNNQIYYVVQWLNYLEREVSQPDLWDDLSKQKIVYDQKIHPEMTNEPFSVFQSEQISEGIENIRKYLLEEFKDNSEFKNLINKKLDYLKDASKRQGRSDWFHTGIGVFVGIATALAMSPDQTKNMWVLFESAITGILRLLPI